jgi:hypothetical protein
MTDYRFEAAFEKAYTLLQRAHDVDTILSAFIDDIHYIVLSIPELFSEDNDYSDATYIAWNGRTNTIMTIVSPTHGDVVYLRNQYIRLIGSDDAIISRDRVEVLEVLKLVRAAYDAAIDAGVLRWELMEGMRLLSSEVAK